MLGVKESKSLGGSRMEVQKPEYSGLFANTPSWFLARSCTLNNVVVSVLVSIITKGWLFAYI